MYIYIYLFKTKINMYTMHLYSHACIYPMRLHSSRFFRDSAPRRLQVLSSGLVELTELLERQERRNINRRHLCEDSGLEC